MPLRPIITCEQLYSRKGLSFLWENRKMLDSATNANVEALWRCKKKGSLQCCQTIRYQTSQSSTAGKLGYGRLYARGGVGLERVEREARGTLCQDYYYDIDIKNCHPVLLVQYAQRLYDRDLTAVRRYVENRDSFLKSLCEDRDEAKQQVLKVLFGGNTDNPKLMELSDQVRSFGRFLSKQPEHTELWEAVKSADNRIASFTAEILQTEEATCLLAMRDSFLRQGWSVDVLAYDGLMIRKQTGKELTEEVLQTVMADIETATSYKLDLARKDFESFEMPLEAEDEFAKAYAEMKVKWEKNHFYFEPTNTIVKILDNGQLRHYALDHAATSFNMWVLPEDPTKPKMAEPTLFLKEWNKDPERRIIDSLVYKKPEDLKPNEATLFSGFTYQKLEPCENPEAVAQFQDLLRAVSGDNEEAYTYTLKWFAKMIQDPFNKPGTALIFMNKTQGTGKDTICLWMKKILGNHVAHYNDEAAFWSPYDTLKEGAIMVYLEEVGSGATKANSAQLKAKLTSDTCSVNPKGVKAYAIPNMTCMVMTTNLTDPVRVEGTDRRFFLNYGSDRLRGNVAFWDKFYKTARIDQIEPNPAWLYPVGKYLESIDLKDFNPRVMPESEYKNEVVEMSEPSEETFIKQWNGVNVSATDLYEAYKEWCIGNSRPYATSSVTFGKNLLAYGRYYSKKRVTKGTVYSRTTFDPPNV
jgi:hypothetical protein